MWGSSQDECVRSANPTAFDELSQWRSDLNLGARGTAAADGKEYLLSRLDLGMKTAQVRLIEFPTWRARFKSFFVRRFGSLLGGFDVG
jgi:hypothetical protein